MPRSSSSGSRGRAGRSSTGRGGGGDPSTDYSIPDTEFTGLPYTAIPSPPSIHDENDTASHGRGTNMGDQAPVHPSHRQMIFIHGDGYVYTFNMSLH